MKPDIAAIRARADAATSGPWVAFENAWDRWTIYGDKSQSLVVASLRDPAETEDDGLWQEMTPTARFIAAARTDVPALCDRVEALEKALLLAKDHVNHAYHCDNTSGVSACNCGADEAVAMACSALEGT